MAIEVSMNAPQLDFNRQRPTPLPVPRTRRNQLVATLTSLPAGKCVPIVAIPMLREDQLSARISVSCEMQETKELLMNPVYMRVTAYCVPLLAFDRFEGSRDQFDRSYMGQPKVEGGAVVPFVEKAAMGEHGSNEIYKALGLHAKPTDEVNTAYLEAYNKIWNFRAINRSPLIDQRSRLNSLLAPAFWQSTRFEHVVPDFDQAVIDGEVPLTITSAGLTLSPLTPPVKTAAANTVSGTQQSLRVRRFDGVLPTGNNLLGVDTLAGEVKTYASPTAASPGAGYYPANLYADLSGVIAELTGDGITVSLSNIELARRTQAFARLREVYEGFDDEWIIDMLMSGLEVPDQALKQPILVADKTAAFGQAKRYATDSQNLAESAVSGAAALELSVRVPRLNTGGVVMVIAECMPEQLFERQKDPFFHSLSQTTWPDFLRDTLDPEKVDLVLNSEVDTDHSAPAATFGYAPLNWKWNAFGPRVGGKFYRPTTNTTTDQERQRIWALETVDPELGEDFYLVTNIHQKPFLDTESDPFELSATGNAVLTGNTVFGGRLVEATGNYDEVMSKAPLDRIEKTEATAKPAG